MGRLPRRHVGGFVYHVLNRAIARAAIFDQEGDYAAFERLLFDASRRFEMRLLSYCLMPNHWHLVLWPSERQDLSSFMHWLTLSHVRRWHTFHGTAGTGHLYQGRYRAFPIEADDHFLRVCRYVEQNPLRAKLVERSEQWRWCSLWHRHSARCPDQLAAWPVEEPPHWLELANEPLSDATSTAIARSIARNDPYGSEKWRVRTATALGLPIVPRRPGRPRR